jgi:ABC-type sugar transport system ATPase subunit
MNAAEGPLISIRHVTMRFPGVVALADVSLDIAAGELHAICGENGAGKSTLMKIVAGVLASFDGELLLKGRPVRFAGPRAAEDAGIGIIHQELNLVEELSAAGNIFLGREKQSRIGWLDDHAMERAAAELFEALNCRIDPRQPVGRLRVGDQQLVEIAKALARDTAVLIMDEPTSALTEGEVARLFGVIGRMRDRGVTIVYISHKMDEIFRLADRITVLRDGRHVRTLAKHETNAREVTHLMVGREIESTHLGAGRRPGDVLLEVEKLTLPWPGHARGWRLKDIAFSLRRGEILGIAGLMGAGRTELLECIFGASQERPQGHIRLEGREVAFRHPVDALRAGMALVTEDRKRLGLFAQMSLGANITICTLGETATAGLVSHRRERRMAETVATQLAVRSAGVDAAVTSLSGGNQQKAILARWLLTRPKVLLLDDPTRGIDVGAKAELYRLMDQLCTDGLGIIVTSSELPELLTLCDRILVICEGRLTGEFARRDATEQRIMEAATRR